MSVLGCKFKEALILKIVQESLEILCPRQRPFSPCPFSPAPVITSPKTISSRKNSLRQWLSTEGEFSSQGSLGDLVTAGQVVVAWSGYRPKMLVDILQWTGQPL